MRTQQSDRSADAWHKELFVRPPAKCQVTQSISSVSIGRCSAVPRRRSGGQPLSDGEHAVVGIDSDNGTASAHPPQGRTKRPRLTRS
jgi:hypothetical protein